MTNLTQRLTNRIGDRAEGMFESAIKSVLAPAIFLANCANAFASNIDTAQDL